MPSFYKSSLVAVLLCHAISASAYNLLNPVPESKMRDLSTDRPDTTESPYTVDAGHYQAEFEILSLGRDDDGTTQTTVTTGSANLKAGLTDNVDIQLVLEPRTRIKTKVIASGSETSVSGRNDTQVRLKINLWGNDEGDTAAAIMPFVEFDTHSTKLFPDGKTEGGIIIPVGFKLPNGWESAAMVEFDFVRNAENTGYATDVLQSITFAHDITESTGGFIEFVNITPRERGSEGESYFDAGINWSPVKNIQFDAGFNAGMNEAAEDLRLFVGFSFKK